jgi:hypothetical protein
MTSDAAEVSTKWRPVSPYKSEYIQNLNHEWRGGDLSTHIHTRTHAHTRPEIFQRSPLSTESNIFFSDQSFRAHLRSPPRSLPKRKEIIG